MLQITADVYSGRPNPTWLVTDDQEIRAALRELSKNRTLVTADASDTSGGLGELRGFHIEVKNDEIAKDYGLSPSLFLPLGSAISGHDLGERLLALATPAAFVAAAADGGAEVEAPDPELLRRLLDQKFGRAGGHTVADSRGSPADADGPRDEGGAEVEAVQPAVTCFVEYSAYNPGFWNNNSHIRYNNNCYNYASNKRTDTFAQPGRGSGQMYTGINCANVSAAALRDGLQRRYVCFPDHEKPRYLVALVIAPGPTIIDYHWYRRNSEGFWSHKPGGTAARNVDNNNRVITNPETCNRGPYTIFCGYFYTCRSQRIR